MFKKLFKPSKAKAIFKFGCNCPCGGGKVDTKTQSQKAKR